MPGRGCVPGERVGVCPGVGLGPGGGVCSNNIRPPFPE